uniref:Uncharacterized protein n=1 Tax=Oryza meridionalis TaxID=40149 RepID=A0A0E0C2D8_9ORYZ
MAVTGGIEPTKLFSSRDELFTNDSGMLPVRSLLPRSTYVSEWPLPKDAGMSPVSLLLARTIICIFGKFPKSEGIIPLSLFLLRISSWEQEESSEGMLPSRAFVLRLRVLSWLSRPSSDGMLPWKLLFDSCNLVRKVRLAMQGDMKPEMPSDAKSIEATRRGDCVLQITPCQLQNSRDALLHESSTPVGPESWDLKQRRVCRSFS